MKFSVILPVYNAEKTVKRAIESVLNQSYEGWHLYIINDCSNDDSLIEIERFAGNSKITIINNEFNMGVAYSRNIGVENSSEEVISFIDSDDEWHPNKLSVQNRYITQGAMMAISYYNYISDQKHTITTRMDKMYVDDFLKKKFRVCLSSLCYVRNGSGIYFEKLGHEDFLFIYRLLMKFKVCYIASIPLVNYHVMAGSLSSDKAKSAKWHYSILNHIYPRNLLKCIYLFMYYIANALWFKLKLKGK